MLNYPLAIVSGIWLLGIGAWQFVLAAVGAILIGPYFMGLFTYPQIFLINSAYKISHLRELKFFISSLWHWIGATIWGYFVITQGIIYGTSANVNLLPVMGLCLAVTTLPFFSVLSDTLKMKEYEAASMLIVLTIFVELAAISSLIIFSVYSRATREILSIVLYSFIWWGILDVPIYYKALSEYAKGKLE